MKKLWSKLVDYDSEIYNNEITCSKKLGSYKVVNQIHKIYDIINKKNNQTDKTWRSLDMIIFGLHADLIQYNKDYLKQFTDML